jgi:uncharacterized membrane protein (UPF0136 family)
VFRGAPPLFFAHGPGQGSLTPMNSLVVLWIYTAFLVVGGVIGFVVGKSRVSLIMSVAFAVPLAVVAAGKLSVVVGLVLLGALVVTFGIRVAKTRKFMPAGMLLALTVIALAIVAANHFSAAKA